MELHMLPKTSNEKKNNNNKTTAITASNIIRAASRENVSLNISDQVWLQPVCSATATSSSLEISDIKTKGIILSRQRTTKRMRRLICTFVVRICHKTHFRMTWPIKYKRKAKTTMFRYVYLYVEAVSRRHTYIFPIYSPFVLCRDSLPPGRLVYLWNVHCCHLHQLHSKHPRKTQQ